MYGWDTLVEWFAKLSEERKEKQHLALHKELAKQSPPFVSPYIAKAVIEYPLPYSETPAGVKIVPRTLESQISDILVDAYQDAIVGEINRANDMYMFWTYGSDRRYWPIRVERHWGRPEVRNG